MKTYNTFSPLFPGFYGTIFEYDGEGNDIEYFNNENKTAYTFEDFNFNYPDYRQRVCRAFVSRLESELQAFLPIHIEMEQIVSPREYNFHNDSINVAVKVNLDRLIKLIKDRSQQAAKYFQEKYTSRDGFISFHSPALIDWIDKKYILADEKHRVGALLDCLCSIEISEEDIYYWADSEMYIEFELKLQTANL